MGLYVILAAIIISVVYADVYLQNPCGSNNRNNEESANRKQGNRLFDSQNNARGGCNKPGAKDEVPEPMKFVVGSYLDIEWTSQHECGGDSTHCTILLQYMCDDNLRDGTTTNRIKAAVDNEDAKVGRHESQDYYAECKTRQQNGGLYHGQQNLKDKTARYTRQNANGGQNGLECPEEKDYYPYWIPTPWRDIAILTGNTEKCADWQKESMNVKSKGYCAWKTKDLLKKKQNMNKILTPLDKAACEADTKNFVWKTVEAHGLPKPVCQAPPKQRQNHQGNTEADSSSIPRLSRFRWQIPNTPAKACTLRIRYNISIGDYDPFNTFSEHDTPATGISTIPIGADNGIASETEAEDRGYKMQNNPAFKPLKVGNEVLDFELQLALNTAQTGRVFQDRSHAFSIIERPSKIPASANIYNLNVRGRRGNAAQTHPGLEYDFTPNDLKVMKGDYVHAQWTGALTWGNNYAGNGQAGTDKHNIVTLKDRNYGGPQPANVHGMPGNSYPSNLREHPFLGFSWAVVAKAALPTTPARKKDVVEMVEDLEDDLSEVNERLEEIVANIEGKDVVSDPAKKKKAKKAKAANAGGNAGGNNGNVGQLDAAPYYVNLEPQKADTCGTWYYLCTRNNAFSNRSQKGRVVVSCGKGDTLESEFKALQAIQFNK